MRIGFIHLTERRDSWGHYILWCLRQHDEHERHPGTVAEYPVRERIGQIQGLAQCAAVAGAAS